MKTSKHREAAKSKQVHDNKTDGRPSENGEEVSGNRQQRLYAEARQWMAAGDYEKARQILNASSASDEMKNAKGVCLMRLGRHEEALRIYRNLVLQSGTMWMRPDVHIHFKVNLCTALLLAGHSAGCAASLAEINRDDHPAVQRLRNAIAAWKRELSLWQKILWWIGQEPSHPVTLSFPAGELDDDQPDPVKPRQPQPPNDGRQAA
jgi:tetratricopeptide (TPR) repeat protein